MSATPDGVGRVWTALWFGDEFRHDQFLFLLIFFLRLRAPNSLPDNRVRQLNFPAVMIRGRRFAERERIGISGNRPQSLACRQVSEHAIAANWAFVKCFRATMRGKGRRELVDYSVEEVFLG